MVKRGKSGSGEKRMDCDSNTGRISFEGRSFDSEPGWLDKTFAASGSIKTRVVDENGVELQVWTMGQFKRSVSYET